jgi:hypothetical protein
MRQYTMPRSKRGAHRQYDSIMRQCRRDMAGGLAYGLDWPTLRATFPERYAHLQAMNAAYSNLPA